MPNLNQLLKFEYEIEYNSEYNLPVKKNFSNPKLYTAGGDLNKRWYVYFSYRNPTTGRLKRVTPFYGEAHKYKTKEDRLYVLSAYRKKMLELLKKGYNPFENNTELYQKHKEFENTEETTTQISEPQKEPQKIIVEDGYSIATNQKTIKEAFDFALIIKKKIVGTRTYSGYASKAKALQVFIKKKYPKVTHINQLSKNIVVQFLNDV
ncbi:MAG: hypothetical protein COC16_04470 [Lutibacter sp.]|nr:MAG: hypothetical protein COC16_04470 [Lutibacter sp.]